MAVVLDLPAKGSLTYYLQLAAYSTEAMAKDTAARFSPTYPVLVLAPPAGAKPLYRVFVGPLNKAESGTLLTRSGTWDSRTCSRGPRRTEAVALPHRPRHDAGP